MNKYDNAMMETAVVWAEQSWCKRNKVGAVISKNERIISNGYNGTVSGADNDCEDIVKTTKICQRCGCTEDNKLFVEPHQHGNLCAKCMYQNVVKEVVELKSKDTVIHAEANALMFATKYGISTENCTMYITLSPCIECAKLMIQAGIKEVVYKEEYRINHGTDFLRSNGILVRKL